MQNRLVLVALVASACSGQPRTETLSSPAAPTACGTAVAELDSWLAKLAGEGRSEPIHASVQLATVQVAPSRSDEPREVHVWLRDDIRILGERVGPLDGRGDILARNVRDVVERYRAKWSRPLTSSLVVIDKAVGWSAVVRVSEALAAAGIAQQHYLMQAGQTTVPRPPASSIDAKFDAYERSLDSSSAAIVATDVSFTDLVFARCEPARAWAHSLDHDARGPMRDRRVAAELPHKLAECECDVEMAAVRRLMWNWWDRDATGAPHAVIAIEVSSQGTGVRAASSARWADMAPALVSAARAGAPLRLVVE